VTDDDDGGDGGNGNNSPNPLTAKTKVHPVKVLTFEEVTFDGSASEPFEDITNYSWHVYKLWLNGPFMEDVTGRTATYRFNKTGTYYVYLSVKDKDGTVATSLDDSRYPGGKNENAGNIIEVLNRQPVMFAQASSADDPDLGPTVVTGPDEPVTFDASGSFDEDGHMQRYEWDFGDDATGAAEVVTHKYLAVGTYVAVCTGYDDDAGSSKGNVTVYVR
jgi:chitodextrinase